MTTLRLQSTLSLGEPCAWLIPGEDVLRWLSVVHTCPGTPRIAILPDQAGLVVLDSLPVDTRGCLPLVREHHVLLPSDQRLHPPITREEAEHLFPSALVCWHPALGPIGWHEDDVINIADLLVPVEPQPSTLIWPPPPPRLHLLGLGAPAPLDVESLMAEWSDGIGKNRPSDLLDKPSSTGPLARGSDHAKRLLGQSILRLINALPGGAEKPTWIDRMGSWAAGLSAAAQDRLESVRERELKRLERLLDENPELGLRYALPLGGLDAGRGQAVPGGRLIDRNPVWGQRGTGGPIDHWDVSGDQRLRLQQRYHALAQRESALGHHTRAAYIYAELIGDLRAAALALRSGRLFREAAALYRDRMRNPAEAAACLEEGGLFAEAGDAYESLGDLLAAARCRESGGNRVAATALRQRAMENLLRSGDRMAAATIAADALHAHDLALSILTDTAPAHGQALACQSRAIGLLVGRGALDQATQHLDALDTEIAWPRSMVATLRIEALTRFTGPARADCDDRLRVLFAEGVLASHPQLAAQWTRASQNDALLHGDVGRAMRKRLTGVSERRRPALECQLPANADWLAAVRVPLGIVAFAILDRRLAAYRIALDGTVVDVHRWDGEVSHNDKVHAFAVGDPRQRIYLRQRSGDYWTAINGVTRPPLDRWPAACNIGTFGPLREDVTSVASDHNAGWWMLIETEMDMHAVHCAAIGNTSSVAIPWLARNTQHILAFMDDHVYVACGSSILSANDDEGPVAMPDDAEIIALQVHRSSEGDSLLAIRSTGVAWLKHGPEGLTLRSILVPELAGAVVGQTSDGLCVIVGKASSAAFDLADNAPRPIAPEVTKEMIADPVAVLPGESPGSVMVLTRRGLLREVRFSR